MKTGSLHYWRLPIALCAIKTHRRGGKHIKIPSYNGLQPPIYVVVSQRSLISAGQRLCLSSLYLQLEVHQAGDSEGEGSKEEAESDPLEADSQQVIRYLIFNIQYLVVSR